jgi:hypothetical protein
VLERQHRAGEVGLQRGPPLVHGQLGDRTDPARSPGASDDAVKLLRPAHRLGDGVDDGVLVRDVGDGITDSGPVLRLLADLLDGCLQFLLGTTADRDVRALAGKLSGHAKADAAAAPGDEDPEAFNAHCALTAFGVARHRRGCRP